MRNTRQQTTRNTNLASTLRRGRSTLSPQSAAYSALAGMDPMKQIEQDAQVLKEF